MSTHVPEFQSFLFRFMHNSVLNKLATSSIGLTQACTKSRQGSAVATLLVGRLIGRDLVATFPP